MPTNSVTREVSRNRQKYLNLIKRHAKETRITLSVSTKRNKFAEIKP